MVHANAYTPLCNRPIHVYDANHQVIPFMTLLIIYNFGYHFKTFTLRGPPLPKTFLSMHILYYQKMQVLHILKESHDQVGLFERFLGTSFCLLE